MRSPSAGATPERSRLSSSPTAATIPARRSGEAKTMTSPFDLTGKTALVTGGNQGLGKAFAFALADAGARVAFCGRRPDANKDMVAAGLRAGHEFLAITADVTDDDEVTTMIEQV